MPIIVLLNKKDKKSLWNAFDWFVNLDGFKLVMEDNRKFYVIYKEIFLNFKLFQIHTTSAVMDNDLSVILDWLVNSS